MRATKISDEVYVADGPIARVGPQEIEFLKTAVTATPRGRVRLCAHRDGDDLLHEMFIVLSRAGYIRPHKHFGKSESFHIVDGRVDVVIFDDHGAIEDVVALGDTPSATFFYRLSAPRYHTLVIHSELVVIHETTNGPFRRSDAEFAPWAPEETDAPAAETFMHRVRQSAFAFVQQQSAQ